MIGWEDTYKVAAAMVPLYVALLFGYGSVKWLHMFNHDHCNAINRFNCYFIVPLFTFQFTAGIDPFHMNFRFLAGDVIAKAVAGVVLVLWANLCQNGELSWAVTSFSLSSFNNTLVVGVPLLNAMYGAAGEDLVVQASVIQFLLWFPILLFLLEFWRISNKDSSTSTTVSSPLPNKFRITMKEVLVNLAKNPNLYACAIGVIWALLAKRWHLEMPSIVEGSIRIMASAGSGVAMFSMGLFMALQEKMMACGVRLTIYGMVLRFVGGPIATLVGCLALGLRSQMLRIAIIQAALPQAIASFVVAQEYGLHANVLSTAFIFGTIASLPLLICYYIALDALP